MKTHVHHSLILSILFCLSLTLEAQENSEPEHPCFRLEEPRILALEMEVQAADSNLFQTDFLVLKEWSEKQIFIRIPAMELPYSILINGFKFASDPGSGQNREYNITPFLQKQSNSLTLQVEDSVEQYLGSPPIPQLLVRDGLLARDMFITTHPGDSENEVLVRLHLYLKSYLKEKNQGRTIYLELRGSGEKEGFQETRELSTPLSYGQETEMIFDVPVKNPVYWFPGDAGYYEAKVTVGEMGKENPERISTLFPIVVSCQIDGPSLVFLLQVTFQKKVNPHKDFILRSTRMFGN
jgi:beta-galactosidase/beta-glucuronidase